MTSAPPQPDLDTLLALGRERDLLVYSAFGILSGIVSAPDLALAGGAIGRAAAMVARYDALTAAMQNLTHKAPQ